MLHAKSENEALRARIRELEEENKHLWTQLEERKLIERAKGAVMRVLRIDEEEAFVRIRRFATDRNLKVIEVARRLIEADEQFRELARCAVDHVHETSPT